MRWHSAASYFVADDASGVNTPERPACSRHCCVFASVLCFLMFWIRLASLDPLVLLGPLVVLSLPFSGRACWGAPPRPTSSTSSTRRRCGSGFTGQHRLSGMRRRRTRSFCGVGSRREAGATSWRYISAPRCATVRRRAASISHGSREEWSNTRGVSVFGPSRRHRPPDATRAPGALDLYPVPERLQSVSRALAQLLDDTNVDNPGNYVA